MHWGLDYLHPPPRASQLQLLLSAGVLKMVTVWPEVTNNLSSWHISLYIYTYIYLSLSCMSPLPLSLTSLSNEVCATYSLL